MQLDTAQLQAFSAAVRAGTFEAAAQELHVTPSAISQRIKALETGVGRVLLQRTKPIKPTESGEAILVVARQIETLTADVARRLGDDAEFPLLPIAVNADSLSTWVMPALADVKDIATFDIYREDEEHTVSLLREGRVMAAVTSVAEPVQGCDSTRLGVMRYRPMATAEFVAQWFADGVTAETLAIAPLIMFDRNDELQDRFLRRKTRKRLQPPRHYVPSTADYSSAVCRGLGWGMIMDIQPEFAEQLVELDSEYVDVKLYWQQWRMSSDVLDTVAEAVRAHARNSLL